MSDPIAAGMATLAAMREQQMVDRGVATRPGATSQTPELDSDGNVIAPAGAVIYEGPATLSDPIGSQSSPATVTEQAGVPNTRILKVPHRANLRPGDVWTMTSCTYSPGMVGDSFVVLSEEERTYATHRRYVLRGSSWIAG